MCISPLGTIKAYLSPLLPLPQYPKGDFPCLFPAGIRCFLEAPSLIHPWGACQCTGRSAALTDGNRRGRRGSLSGFASLSTPCLVPSHVQVSQTHHFIFHIKNKFPKLTQLMDIFLRIKTAKIKSFIFFSRNDKFCYSENEAKRARHKQLNYRECHGLCEPLSSFI